MVKVSPITSGLAGAACAFGAGSAAISGVAETTDNNSDSTIKRMERPILGKKPSIAPWRGALADSARYAVIRIPT